MDALLSRLETLGFEREEYPDGWYWVLMPDSPEKKEKLAIAMGFGDSLWDGPPDEVFLQMNELAGDWQFSFEGEYGSLEENEVLDILDALEEVDA